MSTVEAFAPPQQFYGSFEPPLFVIAGELPTGERETYLRNRFLEERRIGRAAAFFALRKKEITDTAIDAEWGAGTREDLLFDLTEQEALALRLFMQCSNVDIAHCVAEEVYKNHLPPELDKTF